MKLLYISQFFYPENVAGAFRAYENSEIWSEMGAEITVMTAYPNFPTGKLFDGYEVKLLKEEQYKKIRIIRSKIIIKKNTSKLNRILNASSFLMFGLVNIIFNNKKIGSNYDIVLGTTGTILAPILAYIYSKIKKIPFILEIRDITYIQTLAVFKGRKTILYRLVKNIELFLCRRAKKIIVVTNGFKKELIEQGIDSNKIDVILNGVNTSEINISKENKEKKLIFSYIGNLGESQDLFKVIEIFNRIELKNIEKKLIFIGEGAKKEEIKEYIEERNIKNIILKDGMNQDELERYYELSDFNIVSLKNTKHFKNTIPSKIFQIMGRGKNILFIGPKGEASGIISEINELFVCTEQEIDKIVSQIEKNINSSENIKEELKRYEFEFRKIVMEKYDRKKLAEKYYEILNEVR